MVETQELRDAFVARLNKALDEKDGVRKGRGRNVDFFEGLRTQPAFSASTQATHKWLKAESMPGRANMLAIAEWLGVRVEWLQYGEGDMRHGDPQSRDVAALTLAENSLLADLRQAHSKASPASQAVISRMIGMAERGELDDDAWRLVGELLTRLAGK